MRNRLSVRIRCVVGAFSLLGASSAPGQKPTVITAPIGVLFRSRGDTIWREQDSSVWRTVGRGDTLISTHFRNGRPLLTCTLRADGSTSLRALSTTDTLGNTKPGVAHPPDYCFTTDPRGELTRWTSMQGRAMASNSNEPPKSPADPLSYCTREGVLIVQHRDTVRYIRAPTTAPDTTLWMFTGDTTVQRLSPSPRQFGYAMANTIRGEMYNVNVAKDVITKGVPVRPDAFPSLSCSAGRFPTR